MSDKVPSALVAIVAVVGLVFLFAGSGATGAKTFVQAGYGEGYRIAGTTWDQGDTLGFQVANECIKGGLPEGWDYSTCCDQICAYEAGGDPQLSNACSNTCSDMYNFYKLRQGN